MGGLKGCRGVRVQWLGRGGEERGQVKREGFDGNVYRCMLNCKIKKRSGFENARYLEN